MTTARDWLAKTICETDGVQCQCVCAPETRGDIKTCDGPFTAADAILSGLPLAPESIRLELARDLVKDCADYKVVHFIRRERTPFVFDDDLPAPPSEDK